MVFKRTPCILVAFCILFISFWLTLRFYQKKNDASFKEIALLNHNIAGLYELSIPPSQQSLSQSQQKNTSLKDRLDYFVNVLKFSISTNYSTSVLDFRSQFDERMRKLRQNANRIGVSLGDSLGFKQPLPNEIPEHYWVHLDLSCLLLEHLIHVAETQRQPLKISNMEFPQLEMKNFREQFLRQYQVEITFESSYSFIVQVLHDLSQIKEDSLPFLSICQATFSTGTQSDMIISKITFAGLQVHSSAKLNLQAEEKNNVETQAVPLWERY